MNNFLLKNNKKGFTLVETLVAISIFSMSVVTVMSLLGQGVSDINYSRSKVTAEYLAQEGIEYLRNMRDTHVLSTQNGRWNAFSVALTNAGCNVGHGCWFDPEGAASTMVMSFGTCTLEWCENKPLKYDSVTGAYGYAGAVDSGYSRRINTTVLASGYEIQVTSTVSWMQGSRRHNVSFSEVLFNWVQ